MPESAAVMGPMSQPNFDESAQELDESNIVTHFSDESGEEETSPTSNSGPPPQQMPGPPPPPPPPQAPSPLNRSTKSKVNEDVHAQRDELLTQLKEGRELKKAPERKDDEGESVLTMDDMFAEIRSGKKLRKVNESERSRNRKDMKQLKGRVVESPSQERRNYRHEDEELDRRHHRKHGDSREDQDQRGKREDQSGQEKDQGREGSDDEKEYRRRDERHRRREERDRKREEREREREEERVDYKRKDRERKQGNDKEGEGERGSRDRKREEKGKRREYQSDRRRDDTERQMEDRSHRREERGKTRDDTDEDYYSGADRSQPSWRKNVSNQQKTKIGKTGSQFKGLAESSDAVPSWKVSLIERKQEKTSESETVRKHEASANEPAEGDQHLPVWKAALFKKREAAEIERLAKVMMEESQYEHLPEWKRKLVEKKNAEKEATAQVEREKNQVFLSKKAEIAAMPEWKRKLYLQKNPEYLS